MATKQNANTKFPAPLDRSFQEGHGGEDAHPKFRKGMFQMIGTAAMLDDKGYSPNQKTGTSQGTGQEI